MPEKISVCITAGNEEKNIRRCLESVTWADEIIVVDSFSADRTVEISREYTDRVYQHEWLGYVGQKNVIKKMAKHPWVLFIAADEQVSVDLRDKILNEFDTGSYKSFAGYEFPRMVRYLGKWIKHGDWYPDVKLRLFRKEKGKCVGHEPHDRIVVDGRVKRLRGHLYHYTYSGIADQIASLNKFSNITAQRWYEEGKTAKWLDIYSRPLWRFFRGYFLKRGFLDGLPGLIIAISASYGVMIKYAKLWEHHIPNHNNP